MNPSEKAQELVNQYYGYSKTQLEAIEKVERIVLTTICQQIDNLHGRVCVNDDYDKALIVSFINQLKNQQEIALKLQRMK